MPNLKNQHGGSNGESIFVSLLAVLFIGLKLTGHIDWSWLWVLAPIWIPVALFLGALVGVAIHYKITKKKLDKLGIRRT